MTIINIEEIRGIYKEYCNRGKKEFNEKDFVEFLRFLEVDFYDWTRENLK